MFTMLGWTVSVYHVGGGGGGGDCQCLSCWGGPLVLTMLEGTVSVCHVGEDRQCLPCWGGLSVFTMLGWTVGVYHVGLNCHCLPCLGWTAPCISYVTFLD